MRIQITPLDNDAAANGKMFNYRGIKLLVARARNVDFLSKFKNLADEERRNNGEKIDPKRYEELTISAMAGTILVGWETFSVKDNEGNFQHVEFSVENAVNLLTNDSDAREEISAFSTSLDNFLMSEAVAIAGKHQPV